MNHTTETLAILHRLEQLTNTVSLVLNDISAQETGWYYQLQNEMQRSALLIRKYKRAAP